MYSVSLVKRQFTVCGIFYVYVNSQYIITAVSFFIISWNGKVNMFGIYFFVSLLTDEVDGLETCWLL